MMECFVNKWGGFKMLMRFSIFVVFALLFVFITCAGIDRVGAYGQVVSKDSHEPIEGVRVVVEGTPFQTTTEPSGRYDLAGLPATDCTLVFSCTGYDTVRVDVLEMKKGEEYRIDVALQPHS
jgi:hypothetical protein